MQQRRRPVMLVVLDGWGWREETADNAVRLARTPTFDRLWSSCPHALLKTSGADVGLPAGQMGNSEVGHLNIGAGRLQQRVRAARPQPVECRRAGEPHRVVGSLLAPAPAIEHDQHHRATSLLHACFP